jgi:RES domain-containing protein
MEVLLRAPKIKFSGYTYRIIGEKWRDNPLSAIGSIARGGRYNEPKAFPVLYTAISRLTALLEVQALFTTADGQLHDAPRDPELMLTLECALERVLDLTQSDLYGDLGTSREELVSNIPSWIIVNARGETTPTQQLGEACARLGNISALLVPSAADPDGQCLNILSKSMQLLERVSVLDATGRLRAAVLGWREREGPAEGSLP